MFSGVERVHSLQYKVMDSSTSNGAVVGKKDFRKRCRNSVNNIILQEYTYMKKMIRISLMLFPVPFLFHFYEYNCHLTGEEAIFLTPGFLFFILIVGLILRNSKFLLFLGVNSIMIVISLILGYFFLIDDGSWFKPVGRDGAIIFISIIYILGQLFVRGFWKMVVTSKNDWSWAKVLLFPYSQILWIKHEVRRN